MASAQSERQCCDAGFGDLRIFTGLNTTDANRTEANTIFHDGNAPFQQTLNARSTQKRGSPTVDYVFIDLAFTPSQSGCVSLGRCNLRRYGCCTVKALQPQQMTAVIDDGNR